MVKWSAIVASLFIMSAGQLRAQAPTSASVSVTGQVVPALNLTAEGSVDFGAVVPGRHSLSITEGAQLRATGTPDAEIKVRRPASVQLGHLSEKHTNALVVELDVWGSTANDPAQASAVAASSRLQLGDEGVFYFWVGGTIKVPEDARAGFYAGTVTIEVEYY